MRTLRRNVLFLLILLDTLALFTECLIPVLGIRRNTSTLRGLLGQLINLLDAMKEEGPISILVSWFLSLGINIIQRIAQPSIVSTLKNVPAMIKGLGSMLVVSGRSCTQIGVANICSAVHSFREYLKTSKRALQAALQFALDPYLSTLDRLYRLGVLGSPLAWLYTSFVVYSRLKMAWDFARFVGSVVGGAFRRLHNRAITENPSVNSVDIGAETEDMVVPGAHKWDDSLVTPRSSRRTKNALNLGGRKDVRDVISQR